MPSGGGPHGDDAVPVHIPAACILTEPFRGKQDIVDNLCHVLGAQLDGVIELEVERLIAEGEHVVAQLQGRAQSRDGRRYDNTYCVVATVRDGLICDLREYLDTELVSAVFGRA